MEALGWRDVVLVAVAAVAVYMAVSIVRYLSMGRRRPAPPAPPPPAEPAIAASPVPAPAPVPAAPADAWPHTDAEFASHLRSSAAELDLKHLRGDLARMRDELSALSDELADLRKEMDALRAARHVSPLYGEAIVLAQQGLDARAIAERCQISIGEAELVLALSRRKDPGTKGDEDDHERE
jgi:hypothetical protein